MKSKKRAQNVLQTYEKGVMPVYTVSMKRRDTEKTELPSLRSHITLHVIILFMCVSPPTRKDNGLISLSLVLGNVPAIQQEDGLVY